MTIKRSWSFFEWRHLFTASNYSCREASFFKKMVSKKKFHAMIMQIARVKFSQRKPFRCYCLGKHNINSYTPNWKIECLEFLSNHVRWIKKITFLQQTWKSWNYYRRQGNGDYERNSRRRWRSYEKYYFSATNSKCIQMMQSPWNSNDGIPSYSRVHNG